MGDYFTPNFQNPHAMRHVNTTINDVVKALKADVRYIREGDALQEMYVKIGAMDIRSFGKFHGEDAVRADQSIIIVGDRWDIQQRSIQIGVRLLVVTGSLGVDDEVVELAKEKGVSLIVSPYDSATTAWAIRTSTHIDKLVEKEYVSFGPDEKLKQVSRRIANSPALAFMVTDESGSLVGLFTRADVLKTVNTNLVLVDHNEMTQAVPGAGEVNITEVIDHHRLGINTAQPIRFINEPVGSTCTIIANLFRSSNIEPTPEIAGIMMSGIISDTLNLTGPTCTETDEETMKWLENIAGIKCGDLAEEIFNSGSVILSMEASEVITSDQKFYEDGELRFSVSQIEELGFQNFWNHSDDLSAAIGDFVKAEGLDFACVLITDINKHNSLLLIKGEDGIIDHVSYPVVQKRLIFDLKGVVSRKKQLIPYLTSMIRNAGSGITPSNKA